MGERGPEPGHAYGAAAIASIFKDADFPMSKNDIMSQYGDREVEYKKGNPVKISELLNKIPNETFNSPAELEHAVHEEMSK